jgi:predicted amidophosphoribosyltransferase
MSDWRKAMVRCTCDACNNGVGKMPECKGCGEPVVNEWDLYCADCKKRIREAHEKKPTEA